MGGNILGFFSGYFIINFSRMCLRDQIFHVLLEHLISEGVLVYFIIDFVRK